MKTTMKKILKYSGVLLAIYFTVLTCNTLISKKLNETNRENLQRFYYEQKSEENNMQQNNISPKRSRLQPIKNNIFSPIPIDKEYQDQIESIKIDEADLQRELQAASEDESIDLFLAQRKKEKVQTAIKDVINTAKSMNKKLPLDLGDGRTLMDIGYVENKNTMTYTYKYTESIKDLSQKDISEYKDYWKKEVLNVSRKNPNNKHFVIAKVTFIYKLLDRNDIEILKFIITSTEYK